MKLISCMKYLGRYSLLRHLVELPIALVSVFLMLFFCVFCLFLVLCRTQCCTIGRNTEHLDRTDTNPHIHSGVARGGGGGTGAIAPPNFW